jgi:hypothetical protein
MIVSHFIADLIRPRDAERAGSIGRDFCKRACERDVSVAEALALSPGRKPMRY